MTALLAGRRILITGAAAGIGLATLRRCRAAGASVAALDRDRDALAALAGLQDGNLCHRVQADVEDPAAVVAAVTEAAAALGGLDGVVNAAGVDLVAAIDAMPLAEWNRMLAVNLTGPMLVMQAAFPHLVTAGGGTIVNVSSGAGLMPLRHRMAYCASKAGLQMASKALAIEAADVGIRVNTVCPGAVDTALLRSSLAAAPDPEAAEADVRNRYAQRRIAQPDEIAAAILWLTSAESSYVTGTAIAVDGGRTFH